MVVDLPTRTESRHGFTYLHCANGRVLQVPSGGAPEGTPAAAANGDASAGAEGAPPAKITWDQIDWENGPKLTEGKLPGPIQEIMNRALARDRREHEQRHGSTQEQLREQGEKRVALESQLADLQAAIEEIRNPPPLGDDPLKPPPALAKHPHLAEAWLETRAAQKAAEDRAAALEAKEAERQKALETLQAEIQKERETRTTTEQRMQHLRRDREVAGVLASLNVFDPNRLLRLYTDRVEYVPDRDSFAYRNADDQLVDLLTGIKADLPDNFVRPDLTNGGSGAHGASGGPASTTPQTPLDQRTKLSQEREALKAKGAKGQRLSGNEQARLMAIGRELEALPK